MYHEQIDDLYAADEKIYEFCCGVYANKIANKTPRIIKDTKLAKIISDKIE